MKVKGRERSEGERKEEGANRGGKGRRRVVYYRGSPKAARTHTSGVPGHLYAAGQMVGSF